ncbi:thermonuclease family protein [Bacillus sp. REN10]|uniref:thermonuclease family protein n=1 Tax=Bacillus sp. REN10 TaxID=2782541 RepID=UPI00193AE731|nr:thermonuclease family protein [Bacillus sp. REN10]
MRFKTKVSLLFVVLLVLSGCSLDAGSHSTKEANVTSNEQKHDTNTEKRESSAKNDEIRGVVSYVVDGDTMDVLLPDHTTERVRMILVDTPETKHPRLGVQPFGPEASAYTKELLTDKEVKLEMDVQERDRYGRMLAYVWLDGELVNEQLIAEGLARVAIFPPNTKYVDRFEKVQKEAQKQKKGIWSIEDYVTDRGYQPDVKDESVRSNKECDIKGNITSSGEKIYHVPSGQSYNVTKAEELFCTKEEAEMAGYRAAKR